MLEELKKIEEIIKKLDNVTPEEWNKKEDETEEEFEERIREIEEDIEEELIDLISDSILNEQEINEEEAVKEAQEKIEKEYEIYQECFEKDSNGQLILKDSSELTKKGYNLEQEIEKLNAIVENYNNPDSYLERIRNSIKAEKNIDKEIERKVELAKVFISAKIRGEEPVISSNEIKIKKYEDNNGYLKTTKQLNKIPVIQNEILYNNRLLEKCYIQPYTNIPNNITVRTNKNTMINSRVNVPTYTRKIQVLKNIENKMDKSDDLTKQKIMARIELKKVFKEYKDKDLSQNELKELQQKISKIEKKYPSLVSKRAILKLYNDFNICIHEVDGKQDEKKKEIQQIEYEKNIEIDRDNIPEKIKDHPNAEKLLRFFKIGESEKINVNDINPFDLTIAISYLIENNDQENQMNFNRVISEVDNYTGEEFTTNIDNSDENFNIKTLEKMYNLYLQGVKSKDGSREIIKKDSTKAMKYLNKQLEYILYLRDKADSKSDNPIENLKNEARLSNAFNDASVLTITKNSKAVKLMIATEKIKRVCNKEKYGSYESMLIKYLDRVKKEQKMSMAELEMLGEIFYSGIVSKQGMRILKSNKIVAKDIYEKIIKDYKDKKNKNAYNRLLELYNDNTLPIYDTEKAKKIEQKMKQKGIKLEKNSIRQDVQKNNEGSDYVCSDLHGNYEVYKSIINCIDENDKLYILGDAIDRGPDGIKILKDVIKRKEKGQVEFFIGNHEYMMLQTLLGNEKQKENWLKNNGGSDTYEEYKKLSLKEQEKIKEFLLDSFVYKQVECKKQKYYLVHAKAIQDSENDKKTVRQLLSEDKEEKIDEAVWSRSDRDCDERDIAKKGIFTIIGHTPTYSGQIELNKGYIDIDCGTAYDDNSALINLTEGSVQYFNIKDLKEKEKNKEI